MSKERFLKRVPVPHPASINSGLSMCPTKTLLSHFGGLMRIDPKTSKPFPLPKDCARQDKVVEKLRVRLVTRNVGPFSVTGLDVAVVHLKNTLKVVKERNPELYAQLGTAGMLCIRLVRGSKSTPSNHSFGCGVDFTVCGKLDTYGDDLVYQGLLDLYSIMKEFGWFWGAEFSREDAMHFETSAELLAKLLALKGPALTAFLKGQTTVTL